MINSSYLADSPINYSYGFQDPASLWKSSIINQHENIIFYLIILAVIVLWYLLSAKANRDYLFYLQHGNTIELIWTILPSKILWVIGLPSIRLLYKKDEILDPEITIKAIGSQWYLIEAINTSRFYAKKKKILARKQVSNGLTPTIIEPYWVTGFTDAEGCFLMNIQITKSGYKYMAATYRISQHPKDIDSLYGLKDYFGVGKIYIHQKKASFEIHGYKNILKSVIPHFDKYAQVTQKCGDYKLWKKIICLKETGEHLTDQGFKKCLSYKASQNNGFNETLSNLYPHILPELRDKIVTPEFIYPNWLTGFTSGDGSFNIIISKNDTFKTGYQVLPSFEISQHIKDIEQLYKIQALQGCGIVYRHKTNSRIVISKIKDIRNIIIPHFNLYPLINRRQLEFNLWCDIIAMIENKEHLTEAGIIKIRKLRNQLRQVINLDVQSGQI